ncbi:hypothetical protein K7711_42530 [Nocardia sp. CA2R105]|uniref:hypothetical protein n=1 Tax=Nocardia coffeae TaxID=2873381 RepID=UPI001CA7282D|nr:hypothetical protein [Nocardia coffeae]MBY8863206.1 hypothetical protein [Nocardia coffeae]
MAGTLVDVPTNYRQIAQPDPAANSRRVPARSERSQLAMMWQEAKTALVTRVAGPQQLVTVPRLVVPIGHNQLAFRVSSYAEEAEQLAQDGRVIVQPGDWRGNPALGSHQWHGQAQVVTGGTLLPFVQSEIDAKYRWRTSVARMAHRVARGAAPYGDVVVLVTVREPVPMLMPPSP